MSDHISRDHRAIFKLQLKGKKKKRERLDLVLALNIANKCTASHPSGLKRLPALPHIAGRGDSAGWTQQFLAS